MTGDAGRVTFWQPDPRLAPFVSGYHRYDVASSPDGAPTDVFFPSWISIRFTFPPTLRWSVRIGRRLFDPVPFAALFGPTSHAGYVTVAQGTMIGVGVTPVGWARLFGGDLSRLADRVVPLADVVPDGGDLHAALTRRSPDDVFNEWLLRRLDALRPADPLIAAIFAKINDPTMTRADDLASRLDIPAKLLLGLTKRNFGFTPKLLLRRARFVRALVAADNSARGHWQEAARAAGYWDGSHFLRDCHAFLDQPLGDFLAMDKPLNRLSARERSRILGAPMQSLHPASKTPD